MCLRTLMWGKQLHLCHRDTSTVKQHGDFLGSGHKEHDCTNTEICTDAHELNLKQRNVNHIANSSF